MPADTAKYTHGSIRRMMFQTAFAMMAGTLAVSGYNIVDTYFVGRLEGSAPMAAMGFTFPIIMLCGCVLQGLGSGMMTTCAAAFGARRRRRAGSLIAGGLMLNVAISVLVALLGILVSRWCLRRLGAQGEALELAKRYLDVWLLGCLTSSLSHTGNGLLISVGSSRLAAAMMVVGLIVNAILDPAFIFGWGIIPGMGVVGASIATVLSQALSAALILLILNRRLGLLRFQLLPWRELRCVWALITRYAVPAALGSLMIPIGMTVVTRATAAFGNDAVAAAQAAGKLENLAFIFPASFGISMMPVISQNFGARLYGRIDECRRFANTVMFWFLLGVAVLYYAAAPFVVDYFTTVAEVKRLMISYLRIIPFGFWGMELHRYGSFCYMGCHHPKASAWLNAMKVFGLLIPAIIVAFSLFHNVIAIFAARTFADCTAGAISFLLARRMARRLVATGK